MEIITSNYGPDPGPDYPVSRAARETLAGVGHQHDRKALYDAILSLERRVVDIERRLGPTAE